ncbi:asparaginase [Burkholderiaceae bacterium DAT-1]|nr:asparaginase [Burkholderiaceae bacterium DAT-1]
MSKRLFVIYTGGTIGMTATASGYAPEAGYLPRELEKIAASHPGFPAYTLKEYAPLIDSSNLQPSHWNQIVADIEANYPEYDGFVVIHGTDTLAYTASALSFMLDNLSKPVIVTGSMVPLCETPNDAEQNLVDAFMWACDDNLSEVAIAFNRQLMRGNRARKLSGSDINAFGTPNYPILGRVHGERELNQALVAIKSSFAFKAHPIRPDLRIAGLKLYPGFSASLIAGLLSTPLDGLVLETYGAGNVPDYDPALLAALTEASKRGTVIINCTQCPSGRVAMGHYAASSALGKAGLVSGGDMTVEAAITKLYALLSQSPDLVSVRERAALNLRGEVSLDNA